MSEILRTAVREPGASSPSEYRRRVVLLAATYVAMFGASLAGLALLLWRAKFLVTLSQRSNVETLTLLFLLVFFTYVGAISFPGVSGAMRMLAHVVRRRANPAAAAQGVRQGALRKGGDGHRIAVNVIIEQQGRPAEPFAVSIADDDGDMGQVRVDGACIDHEGVGRHGASNELLAFFVEQVNGVLDDRGERQRVEILGWRATDDERMAEYLSHVAFARNLQRQLGSGTLWPSVALNASEIERIGRALAEICETVRRESFLPDWEYSAEHKLPVIPEPLGLVSLTRVERRADPLASMGCAAAVVALAVFVLALVIILPPWVPGS
jgi:hypothetical protein